MNVVAKKVKDLSYADWVVKSTTRGGPVLVQKVIGIKIVDTSVRVELESGSDYLLFEDDRVLVCQF